MLIALGLLATTISHAVTQQRPAEQVTSVIVHGGYALASGRTPAGTVHDGLRQSRGGWRIVCSFTAPLPASELQKKCGFPSGIAAEMQADLAAQNAAQTGDFSTAAAAQQRAYMSASGPERDDERARVQLLTRLNDQLRLGMITRQQAIQQWNQFRLSWALP